MNGNDSFKLESIIKENLNKIELLTNKIITEYKNSVIDPNNLEEIRKVLKLYLRKNKSMIPNDRLTLFSVDNLKMFRRFLLVEDKTIRILTLKIIRYYLELNPAVSTILKSKLFQLIICKIFEDHKYSSFEERLECFKFINTWLRFSEGNFPLIFCQGVVAISKGQDEYFKKGTIEFLRNLAVKRPDFCQMVSGFKILINTLLDENYIDISDNIFYTLIHLINSPEKRKFLNSFTEFYKTFSIFTKSDFSINSKEQAGKNVSEKENAEERNKLDIQLALSKRVIEKLLKTWPGYSLLMGNTNNMAMNSIIESINTDTNYIIKKNVLDILKEIIENEYYTCDNFNTLQNGDNFYINKVYLAYILQGLENNKLYSSLIKFIEKENNPLSEYTQKIALKFVILYSKLSNIDLQLPFLNNKLTNYENLQVKLINSIKPNMNGLLNNSNAALIVNTNNVKVDADVINTKIKIMNMLDQTFYHFNCKELSHIEVKDLSDIILLALSSVCNLQNIRKYNNQYSIEVSKKELYMIDEQGFQNILKHSKILELREFVDWDWRRIEEILDIVEYRKELIPDLYKQRFFKRLLYAFMPSKNSFVTLSWNPENFQYASVGAKFFKILSNSVEGMRILDTSPEENYFTANKTWFEDVYSCLEQLFAGTVNTNTSSTSNRNLNSIRRDQGPFSLKRICKTMSRHIFVFLGIISQSTLGEEYLSKKQFYELMKKGLSPTGKFDYLFTNLIDNLNFNTKNAVDLIQDILEIGSKRIKRYVFEHIRCLFKFGKEVLWSFKIFKFAIDHDAEVGKIVINILQSLFTEGKYIEDFLNSKPLIDKIRNIQKEILFTMMKHEEAYEPLQEFIEEEVKTLSVKEVVEKYSTELEDNMQEIFNTEENTPNDYYYLHINLPKIENQYENFSELFWIKQLPFNINIGIIEDSGHNNLETVVLNTYLEFHDSSKLILYSLVHDEIKINVERHSIKFICMVGDQIIDNHCRMIYHANFLTFDTIDFKSIREFYKNNNRDEQQYYRVEKDGVVINLSKDASCKHPDDYIIYSIYFYIKIIPSKKQPLKTPINLITELANSQTGMERIVEMNVVETLFSYIESTTMSLKFKKSAIWILGKITSKEKYGKWLNDKYKIINRIYDYFNTCEDYAMKGTIIYVFCYASVNPEIKLNLSQLGFEYFFNTDICLPGDMSQLYLNFKGRFENKKIFDDLDKINKYVNLNEKCDEIYNCVANLLNTISYKQAYEKLNETFKNDSKLFNDPSLVIKLFSVLSMYKYRQPLRRFILSLMENSLSSEEILEMAQKQIDNLSDDLF